MSGQIIIKTADELATMREAGRKAAQVLRMVCDAVRPGISTRELDDLARDTMAALGVRSAHLNQPVELAALRPAFGAFLGIAYGRPDLVIRFGRGPAMPRSLRRPLDAVLT